MKKMFGMSILLGVFLCSTSVSAAAYSTAINSRPLTLPESAWGVSTAFVADKSFDVGAIGFDFAYGLSDHLQLDLGFGGLALMPEVDIDLAFGLGVNYSVMDEADLDIDVGLSLPLNFNSGADIVSAMGIHLNTRYNLMGGDFSIHTGHNFISLDFSGDFAMAIHLPIAFAYQASEHINLRLGTKLLSIGVVGGGGVTSIADKTPLDFALAYALDNSMDITVGLMADAQAFGDTMMFMVGFAYRGL